MADHIGQQLGNYRLIRLLGSGGFADVYLGEHMYLKTQAAIKLFQIQPDTIRLQPFFSEERNLLTLQHRHIIRALEFGIEGNIPYIATEYLPRGTLRDKHRDGTPVPLETVISYVNQVADALQYVHSRKVIHGDVKPSNMFIADNGDILLGDFGIARFFEEESESIAGTPAYMAPEVFRGKPLPASDQYSLAIVAYEWLCGTLPFVGTKEQLIYQNMYEQPEPLRSKNPSIPRAVEQVIFKAIAKRPEDRFSSVQEFARALQATSRRKRAAPPSLQQEHTVEAFQPPPPPRSAPGILRGLDDLLGELFSRREQRKSQEPQDTQLKLFAIARTQLENDDRAFVGKTYFVETAISQNRPEGFTGGRFTVNVQDLTAPIPFDIVVHADKNIEFLHGWHQRLHYIPTNREPQLVLFPFKVTAEGKVSLTINFYREQQWLHTVELEFEGIDQSQLAKTIYER